MPPDLDAVQFLCAFAGVLRFSFCLLMSALPQVVTHRCYFHETIRVKSWTLQTKLVCRFSSVRLRALCAPLDPVFRCFLKGTTQSL